MKPPSRYLWILVFLLAMADGYAVVEINANVPETVASGVNYYVWMQTNDPYGDNQGESYISVSKNGSFFSWHSSGGPNATCWEQTVDYGAQTVVYEAEGSIGNESTSGNLYYTQILAANDAEFVSHSFASGSMEIGSSRLYSVTFKNVGTGAWSTDSTPHRLGSQNPYDNGTWGFGRVALQPSESVAPNSQKTFSFYVIAPQTPGTYNLQWGMLEESVEWFGDSSPNIQVSVVGDGTPPTTPGELQSTGVTSSSISLAWGAATDSGSGLAGYKLYRRLASQSAGAESLIASPSTTSYTDTGLSYSTGYAYYVKAYDFAGNLSGGTNTLTTATATNFTAADTNANGLPDWIESGLSGGAYGSSIAITNLIIEAPAQPGGSINLQLLQPQF
jgi:hypothetical protein